MLCMYMIHRFKGVGNLQKGSKIRDPPVNTIPGVS